MLALGASEELWKPQFLGWDVSVIDLVGNNTVDTKCYAETGQAKQAAATRTPQTDPFMV